MRKSLNFKDKYTIQWLRKRFGSSASIHYLNSEDEVKILLETEDLFNRFDEDGSGTMELREFHELFKQNGINIDIE